MLSRNMPQRKDLIYYTLTCNPAPTKEDLMEDMKKLLDSNLNFVIGVFFKNNYADIMEAAGELGVAR